MATILSGIPLRDKIKDELAVVVFSLAKADVPELAIIQVGENEASSAYIKGKIKFGEEIGVPVQLHHLAEDVPEEEVIELIQKLNDYQKVKGIILQLPLPVP